MLIEDIKPYVDGNGLVSNSLVPSGIQRGSDNGPLFTSQLLILASLNKEAAPGNFASAISKCIDSNGHIHRAPDDATEDAPDDYYGVSSLTCFSPEVKLVPSLPIAKCQPLLLYMQLIMRKIPIYRLFSPLAAIVIALSNINEDPGSTSNKLLTWTEIKGLNASSTLCRLAGKIWTWRMKKIYGTTQQIALIYFGSDHPFVKYWIE